MKKVNFNQSLCELNGEEIIQKDTPMLIKTVVSNRLVGVNHENDLDKTFDRFNLARRINESKSAIEIEQKDIDMIRDSLQGLPVLIVGQIWKLLI